MAQLGGLRIPRLVTLTERAGECLPRRSRFVQPVAVAAEESLRC
jgi:hypothetical protein